MYVRIARFESSDGSWENWIDGVRARIAEARRDGTVPVQRALMLVDRKSGRGANIMFCATREDLERVDQHLNSLTPEGGGTRISVEMYEIAVDSDEL